MREYYIGIFTFSPYDIYHHGIKGQKWGVRRFVNPDDTLTPAGKHRYGTIENFKLAQEAKSAKLAKQNSVSSRSSKVKTAAKIGLAIAGAGLAAYGAYKLNSLVEDKYRSYVTDQGKRLMRGLEETRSETLRYAKRRDRKKINADFDSRKERLLNIVAEQKSTKQMRKNLKGLAKNTARLLIKR